LVLWIEPIFLGLGGQLSSDHLVCGTVALMDWHSSICLAHFGGLESNTNWESVRAD
jgi:hypothetical protein